MQRNLIMFGIVAVVLVSCGIAVLWMTRARPKTHSKADGSRQFASVSDPQSNSVPTEESEKELISKSSDFDICKVYNFDFQELRCSEVPPFPSTDTRTCEHSSASSSKMFQILRELGFVRDVGQNFFGDWIWIKLPKSRDALGTTIIQQQTGTTSPFPMGTYQYPRYGYGVPYRWKVITGCREMTGIDATTPLNDGVKIDFSWHWKPTEVGKAEGFTEERKRGVAYLVRKGDKLAIDQIQINSDDSE